LLNGRVHMAISIVLHSHFLLRPEESREVTWSAIPMFDDNRLSRYPNVFSIIGIGKPKMRRSLAHAKFQFVTIECPVIAGILGRVNASVAKSQWRSPLWEGMAHVPDQLWRTALRHFGLGLFSFTSTGLRGGFAADFFLRTQDAPRLLRRGRCISLQTLEICAGRHLYRSLPAL
jgi:hypothetical protein